ncbi:hypothetical protein M514_11224 [Trichuris suis]|uniref:Uncharacterized protein n=1 Tax=Trichuris suis TaxID=68888 RepID=A0A085N594_9BILA|nr:hypothetical protein M514_11224 [Trichuris suis]
MPYRRAINVRAALIETKNRQGAAVLKFEYEDLWTRYLWTADISLIFWSGQIAGQSDRMFQMRQGKRVVECLRKGLKIASQCVDPYVQVQLFIEVLNHYICFSEDGCPDQEFHVYYLKNDLNTYATQYNYEN